MKPPDTTPLNTPELTRVCVGCGQTFTSFHPHCPHCGLIPKSLQKHIKARNRLWYLVVFMLGICLLTIQAYEVTPVTGVILQTHGAIIIATLTSILLSRLHEKSHQPFVLQLRKEEDVVKAFLRPSGWVIAFMIQFCLVWELTTYLPTGLVTAVLALTLTFVQTAYILSLTPTERVVLYHKESR